MGGFEQRADLGLRETSDATADLRDEERQFGMSLCKRNKLINIGGDGLHPTLHRRDAVALPLKAHSLPPNGAKLAISQEGCAATMCASQIAAKYENLIFTEFGDTVWCKSFQQPVRRLTGTDYQHITANLGNIWETL